MTETAPRSRLGNVTDQVIALAVLNIVWGGGLALGSLALLLLVEQPSLGCYPQRLTAFWVAFWIGAAGSVLAGLGFAESSIQGWSVSRRRFVTAVGAASFALPVFQIGMFVGWNLRTRVTFLCVGAGLLIAGLAMLRARRWGAYLEIASMLAASCGLWSQAFHPSAGGFPSDALNFFGFVLLAMLLAFLDPLSTFLFGEQRRFILRLAPVRILLRGVFKVSIALTVLAWILMSLLGSPNLATVMDRSRTNRTMSNMWSMMTTLEKYAETNKIYPPTQDVSKLARVLEPSYIPVLPRNDAWGRPLEYYRVTLPSGVQGFVIRSAGCDGVFEHKDPTAYTDGYFKEKEMDRDLVFSTVSKWQVPEGVMPP